MPTDAARRLRREQGVRRRLAHLRRPVGFTDPGRVLCFVASRAMVAATVATVTPVSLSGHGALLPGYSGDWRRPRASPTTQRKRAECTKTPRPFPDSINVSRVLCSDPGRVLCCYLSRSKPSTSIVERSRSIRTVT